MATWSSGEMKFKFYKDHQRPQTNYLTWNASTTSECIWITHHWGDHDEDYSRHGDPNLKAGRNEERYVATCDEAEAMYKTLRHWMIIYGSRHKLKMLDDELDKQMGDDE